MKNYMRTFCAYNIRICGRRRRSRRKKRGTQKKTRWWKNPEETHRKINTRVLTQTWRRLHFKGSLFKGRDVENCVYGYVFRVILSGNDVQKWWWALLSYVVGVRNDNSLIRSWTCRTCFPLRHFLWFIYSSCKAIHRSEHTWGN